MADESTRRRRARQEVNRCEAILANKRRKLEGLDDEVGRLRFRRKRAVERASAKFDAAKRRMEAAK